MKPKEIKERTPLFKKFKTYSAAEIIAAGGATEFGILTGFAPKKLYKLGGEPILQEEYEAAPGDLKRK